MDAEFAKNLFAETQKQWIAPELARRFSDNIPPDFKIHRCLVLDADHSAASGSTMLLSYAFKNLEFHPSPAAK